MSTKPSRREPLPNWRLLGAVTAAVLAWPWLSASDFWRGRHFRQVVRRAAGNRYRLLVDGLEVSGPTCGLQLVNWDELASGRWMRRRQPSIASGDEDQYALDLPQQHIALGGPDADLSLVLHALRERGSRPQLHDSGRAAGAAGWMGAMAWLMAALATLACALWSR